MEQETLVQKIEQASDDLALLHRAVHGTETETVLLGGVPTPSYRKLVADVDARESAAAQTAIAAGVHTVEAIADTAAQHVAAATQLAVAAATEQAERAKGYADAAEAVLPDALAQRVTDAETKNTQQDTRLTAVESGVTAISTTLIGSVFPHTAAADYVPNGCVPANGGEYTRSQFPSLYDTYLAGGKLLTCTYAAWTAQVAQTGNCAKFALDADAQKFKVPLYKDGDSITQATSAAELGKSVKAGLPNATSPANSLYCGGENSPAPSGALVKSRRNTGLAPNLGTASGSNTEYIGIDLSQSNPIYGNSTTVTDEQVRLRHFVVVASAQNSASVFDWSNYMAALAGKANADMSNITPAGSTAVAYYAMPSNTRAVSASLPASGGSTPPAPAHGEYHLQGGSTAAGQAVQIINELNSTWEITYATGPGASISVHLEVEKGQSLRVYYQTPTSPALKFVPKNGAY